MDKLLELLEQDCSMTTEQLATIAGMSEADVKAAIHKYEEERVILGYKAIIDWDRVHKEAVTALIEVNVVPQSADGFDRIAERIYQYDEVESMYLMSGSFDLTVIRPHPAGGGPVRQRAAVYHPGRHRHGHPLHFEKI